MKNIILVITIFLTFFLLVLSNIEMPSGKYYNCRDIDFLPDVPPKVREECRKVIRERLEEQRKQQEDKKTITT